MASVLVHRRQPTPEHRLVDYGGCALRIPADCSVAGMFDLDDTHKLIVMKRRVYPHRPNLWARAVVLRVFHLPRGSLVWIGGAPSVTIPASAVPVLISLLKQIEETGAAVGGSR